MSVVVIVSNRNRSLMFKTIASKMWLENWCRKLSTIQLDPFMDYFFFFWRNTIQKKLTKAFCFVWGLFSIFFFAQAISFVWHLFSKEKYGNFKSSQWIAISCTALSKIHYVHWANTPHSICITNFKMMSNLLITSMEQFQFKQDN